MRFTLLHVITSVFLPKYLSFCSLNGNKFRLPSLACITDGIFANAVRKPSAVKQFSAALHCVYRIHINTAAMPPITDFTYGLFPLSQPRRKYRCRLRFFLFCFGNILICNVVKLIRNVVFIADAGLIVVHTLHVKRPVGRHGYHGAAALRAFF
mgnify:CR=1 FL=1